jgi:hypothetical protein
MSPVFQVEMRWQCSTCQHENLGRHKKCRGCGKPKGRERFYDAPGTETPTVADAVTDPDLVEQAEAGPDWECVYCGGHGRRDNGECINCGSKQGDSREHETKWDDGTVGPAAEGKTELEELQAEDAKVKEEIAAEATEEVVGYRTAPKRKVAPKPVAVEPLPAIPMRSPFPVRLAAFGTLVAILLGVGGWLIFRTRVVEATVTALSWQHTVHVERYQVVRDEGFDPPGDATDIDSVGMRHHHYKQVPDGTKQVPYTEQYQCGESCSTTPVRCSSNKNGFKTCSGGDRRCSPKHCSRTKYRTETKYRDVSVEQMWYRWKAWRWRHNRDVVAQGTTDTPHWPSDEEVGLNKGLGSEAKGERASREVDYMVVFTDREGEEHIYEPATVEEFGRYPVGTGHRLRVGVARGIEVLPPGKE